MVYELFIDNPFIIENDDFAIYSTQALKEFSERSFNELNENKKRILNYFNLKEFRKVNVILYDDIKVFRNFVLSLRGEGAFLPNYATGVFDKGMIICYIDLESIKDSNHFGLKAKNNVHEFIHIVNREKIYKERIVWLDEGLAVNLDGKQDDLQNNNNFKKFFIEKILSIKELPIMNDLKHGSTFKNELYDGYDLAYLCVKYLMEAMSNNEFQKVLRDYDSAIEIGKTILIDAIKYYKEKFGIK